MDHRVKTIERGWRWSERFENTELECLFQRYSAKVQNRSTFLIFAFGNALLALSYFRFSVETLALFLNAVTLFGLWILQRVFGKEWILTYSWVLSAILFCVITIPAPIPERSGNFKCMHRLA